MCVCINHDGAQWQSVRSLSLSLSLTHTHTHTHPHTPPLSLSLFLCSMATTRNKIWAHAAYWYATRNTSKVLQTWTVYTRQLGRQSLIIKLFWRRWNKAEKRVKECVRRSACLWMKWYVRTVSRTCSLWIEWYATTYIQDVGGDPAVSRLKSRYHACEWPASFVVFSILRIENGVVP